MESGDQGKDETGRHFRFGSILKKMKKKPLTSTFKNRIKWYFVTKIVLTVSEKKIF